MKGFAFNEKSKETSRTHRNLGNTLFGQKNLQGALQQYNNALLFAPNESEEFYLALGNRSAVLFEKKYFTECLVDIDRILSNTSSDEIRAEKLRNRRKKAEECLETAQITAVAKEKPPQLFSGASLSCSGLSSAVSVSIIENQGRSLVANRDIEPGSVLIVENPLTSVLLPEKLDSYCGYCMRKLPCSWLPCKICPELRFCSETCRDSDRFHVAECRVLQDSFVCGPAPPLAVRTVLAVGEKFTEIDAFPKEKEGVFWVGNENSAVAQISWLNSHQSSEDRAQLRSFIQDFIGMLSLKKDEFPAWFGAELLQERLVNALVRIVPKMTKNAHRILTTSFDTDRIPGYEEVAKSAAFTIQPREKVGSGLFLVASLLNHSCNPNVCKSFWDGKTMVVRAVRSIAKGEQILDCYGPKIGTMTKEARQATLLTKFFFHCQCADGCESKEQNRNEMEMTAFCCFKCSGPVKIYGRSGKCTACGRKSPNIALETEKAQRAAAAVFKALKEKQCNPANLLDPLQKIEKIWYTNNQRLTSLRDKVGRKLAENGFRKESAEIFERNVAAFRKFFGTNSIEVAEQLVKLIPLLDDAKKVVLEAENICRIHYGPDCQLLKLLAKYK